MKLKAAGILVLLAGTATVFAATHSSLKETVQPSVSGVADVIERMNNKLDVEMEFVGLEPNSLYLVRLENTTCQNLPRKVSALPSGLAVAMFVESNQYGSYRTLMRGLPEFARTAQSVALYSDNGDLKNSEVTTVYCQNIG